MPLESQLAPTLRPVLDILTRLIRARSSVVWLLMVLTKPLLCYQPVFTVYIGNCL